MDYASLLANLSTTRFRTVHRPSYHRQGFDHDAVISQFHEFNNDTKIHTASIFLDNLWPRRVAVFVLVPF